MYRVCRICSRKCIFLSRYKIISRIVSNNNIKKYYEKIESAIGWVRESNICQNGIVHLIQVINVHNARFVILVTYFAHIFDDDIYKIPMTLVLNVLSVSFMNDQQHLLLYL